MPPGMPVLSCSLPDFRTKAPFSTFCTEVSCSVPLLTSVPKACFLLFVRKFHALYPCGLPYPRPVFCFLDGSFLPHMPADFRTKATFSAFWMEVSRSICLLTSVPKPRFQCFVRKFRALYPCGLPYQNPVFTILDGSRSSQLLPFTAPFPCISLYF